MLKTIQDVRWIDPYTGAEKFGNMLIRDGFIAGESTNIPDDSIVIQGNGHWLLPGFIDLHVHLRQPGGSEQETLESGAAAAVAGGYTTVVCMPNTKPPLDNKEIINELILRCKKLPVDVFIMGCATKGQFGQQRVDFKEYDNPRIVGVTDDGFPIRNAALMMDIMREAKKAGLIIGDHCEEPSLMGDRSVNKGWLSEKMGLQGVPAIAEDLMVQRNILLSKATGCPIHLQHISTKSAVEMIFDAKQKGIPVTCEATPHHFSLNEKAVLDVGTNGKMSPPLRTESDRLAICQGLQTGIIDCIATDHAPHTMKQKSGNFVDAANGIVGLETAFSVAVTFLLSRDYVTLTGLIELMSTNPASILGLSDRGSLEVGKVADLVLADLDGEEMVMPELFYSRGRNTPFGGFTLKGTIQKTIKDGVVVYEKDGRNRL